MTKRGKSKWWWDEHEDFRGYPWTAAKLWLLSVEKRRLSGDCRVRVCRRRVGPKMVMAFPHMTWVNKHKSSSDVSEHARHSRSYLFLRWVRLTTAPLWKEAEKLFRLLSPCSDISIFSPLVIYISQRAFEFALTLENGPIGKESSKSWWQPLWRAPPTREGVRVAQHGQRWAGREATQEAQVRAMGVERILAAMLAPPAALVIQVAVQGTSTAMGLEEIRIQLTRGYYSCMSGEGGDGASTSTASSDPPVGIIAGVEDVVR